MPDWKKVIKPIAYISLVIIIVIAFRYLLDWGSDLPQGEAVRLITSGENLMFEAAQRDIATLIGTNFTEYRSNAARWSFVYFGCIFAAAILSALAGALIKMDFFKETPADVADPVTVKSYVNDIAAICAVLATVLGVISTTGDFQRKWHANRMAAAGMENLAYRLLKKPVADEERTKIISEIQEINLKRNQEIVGDINPALNNSSSAGDTQKNANSNQTTNTQANVNQMSNQQSNANQGTNIQANVNSNKQANSNVKK